MNKFENVDIITSLEQIMQTNTKHYQRDFEDDRDYIQRRAKSKNPRDKWLLWLSRTNGTWCVREYNTFINDSTSNNIWKSYAFDSVLAYAVKINRIENGTVTGNLYELDYHAHSKHVAEKALPCSTATLQYEKGYEQVPFGQIPIIRIHPLYGRYTGVEYSAAEPEKIKRLLENEHRKYEKLPLGDIKSHIAALQKQSIKKVSVKEQLNKTERRSGICDKNRQMPEHEI